jgi:hypothetical protein
LDGGREDDIAKQLEQLEKKVIELQAFNWLRYFEFEDYDSCYFGNQKEVSAETIISAFEIMKKKKRKDRSDDYKVSLKLYEIIKNMNDENLEKLIPFLIENNLGISKGGMANLKFNNRKFLEILKNMSSSLDIGFFEKIQRVNCKNLIKYSSRI